MDTVAEKRRDVRQVGELLHLRVQDGPLAMVCGADPNGAWFVREREAFVASLDAVRDVCPKCAALAAGGAP